MSVSQLGKQPPPHIPLGQLRRFLGAGESVRELLLNRQFQAAMNKPLQNQSTSQSTLYLNTLRLSA